MKFYTHVIGHKFDFSQVPTTDVPPALQLLCSATRMKCIYAVQLQCSATLMQCNSYAVLLLRIAPATQCKSNAMQLLCSAPPTQCNSYTSVQLLCSATPTQCISMQCTQCHSYATQYYSCAVFSRVFPAFMSISLKCFDGSSWSFADVFLPKFWYIANTPVPPSVRILNFLPMWNCSLCTREGLHCIGVAHGVGA